MSDRPSVARPRPEPLDALIVGGGVAGLALAALLKRRRPSWTIRILEAQARPGGTVGSIRHDGFTTDVGPIGALDDADGVVPLARELGLAPVPAAPEASRRWIWANGGLRPLPTSPPSFLASELLGPAAKLRALAEPLVPAADREESVHAFLIRRFGYGVARALAEAAVLGVSGGDPTRLSLDALFPSVRDLERRHGSVLVGALRKAREAKTRAAATAGAAPRPRLHGFGAEGMQAWVDALAGDAGEALRTEAPVERLERSPSGTTHVTTADGARLEARRTALAVPPHAAAALVGRALPEVAAGLAAMRSAPMRVVGLGYHRIDVPHPLDGFGFLIPRDRGVRSLGVLFGSSLFPGQAPPEHVHLRVLAGGVRDPEAAELSDDAALAFVRRDLRVTLGVDAAPVSLRQVRWARAIPQAELGHAERVASWRAALQERLGVTLLGAAYGGIGLNGAVRDARRVAQAWAPEPAQEPERSG